MSSRSVAKLSISIPKSLEESVRRRVGARGLSGFAARAMAHELERMELGAFLEEMEHEVGPVPDVLLRKARAAWRKS